MRILCCREKKKKGKNKYKPRGVPKLLSGGVCVSVCVYIHILYIYMNVKQHATHTWACPFLHLAPQHSLFLHQYQIQLSSSSVLRSLANCSVAGVKCNSAWFYTSCVWSWLKNDSRPLQVFTVLWKSVLYPNDLVRWRSMRAPRRGQNPAVRIQFLLFFSPHLSLMRPGTKNRASWEQCVIKQRFTPHTSPRPWCGGAGSGDPQVKLGDAMLRSG